METTPENKHPWIHEDDPAMTLYACRQALHFLAIHDEDKDETGSTDEGHTWIMTAVMDALKYEENRAGR